MDAKKLRVGWFSFTCCEDSTMIFIELFNQHYKEWLKILEFVHAKVLQTQNKYDQMDVAFVEGAISSPTQKEKLLKIRGLSTKLVAIGACACTGLPSAQRNYFKEALKEEILPDMKNFDYTDKVQTLDQIVTVDDKVQGCPMAEMMFLKTLDKYLIEFNIINK